MRQVLTSNKSMPASMTVLANENCHKSQLLHHAGGGAQILNAESNNGIAAINQSGQFILVQRAGIAAGENRAAPRASSAPPAQNLVRTHMVHFILRISLTFHSMYDFVYRFRAAALAWQSAVAVDLHQLMSINPLIKRSSQQMIWDLMQTSEKCLTKVCLPADIHS